MAGMSWPTADMSTANLKYLSSAQALADLARFVSFFQHKVGQCVIKRGNKEKNIQAQPSRYS
jgi:hypothetical protein